MHRSIADICKVNWRQINRRVSPIFLAIIQAFFLVMIFRENLHFYLLCTVFVAFIALLLFAHFKLPLHHDEHIYEHILVAIWIPVGAVAAYYLNNGLHLGPVLAAAIVGSIGSILPVFNHKSDYLKHLPAAIYCGAFIGMSNLKVASGLSFVIAASFFAAIGLVLSKGLFLGMGGKLGLIAFAGVVIASFILSAIHGYAH